MSGKWSKLTVAELKGELQQRGLQITGVKRELIARLLNFTEKELTSMEKDCDTSGKPSTAASTEIINEPVNMDLTTDDPLTSNTGNSTKAPDDESSEIMKDVTQNKVIKTAADTVIKISNKETTSSCNSAESSATNVPAKIPKDTTDKCFELNISKTSQSSKISPKLSGDKNIENNMDDIENNMDDTLKQSSVKPVESEIADFNQSKVISLDKKIDDSESEKTGVVRTTVEQSDNIVSKAISSKSTDDKPNVSTLKTSSVKCKEGSSNDADSKLVSDIVDIKSKSTDLNNSSAKSTCKIATNTDSKLTNNSIKVEDNASLNAEKEGTPSMKIECVKSNVISTELKREDKTKIDISFGSEPNQSKKGSNLENDNEKQVILTKVDTNKPKQSTSVNTIKDFDKLNDLRSYNIPDRMVLFHSWQTKRLSSCLMFYPLFKEDMGRKEFLEILKKSSGFDIRCMNNQKAGVILLQFPTIKMRMWGQAMLKKHFNRPELDEEKQDSSSKQMIIEGHSAIYNDFMDFVRTKSLQFHHNYNVDKDAKRILFACNVPETVTEDDLVKVFPAVQLVHIYKQKSRHTGMVFLLFGSEEEVNTMSGLNQQIKLKGSPIVLRPYAATASGGTSSAVLKLQKNLRSVPTHLEDYINVAVTPEVLAERKKESKLFKDLINAVELTDEMRKEAKNMLQKFQKELEETYAIQQQVKDPKFGSKKILNVKKKMEKLQANINKDSARRQMLGKTLEVKVTSPTKSTGINQPDPQPQQKKVVVPTSQESASESSTITRGGFQARGRFQRGGPRGRGAHTVTAAKVPDVSPSAQDTSGGKEIGRGGRGWVPRGRFNRGGRGDHGFRGNLRGRGRGRGFHKEDSNNDKGNDEGQKYEYDAYDYVDEANQARNADIKERERLYHSQNRAKTPPHYVAPPYREDFNRDKTFTSPYNDKYDGERNREIYSEQNGWHIPVGEISEGVEIFSHEKGWHVPNPVRDYRGRGRGVPYNQRGRGRGFGRGNNFAPYPERDEWQDHENSNYWGEQSSNSSLGKNWQASEHDYRDNPSYQGDWQDGKWQNRPYEGYKGGSFENREWEGHYEDRYQGRGGMKRQFYGKPRYMQDDDISLSDSDSDCSLSSSDDSDYQPKKRRFDTDQRSNSLEKGNLYREVSYNYDNKTSASKDNQNTSAYRPAKFTSHQRENAAAKKFLDSHLILGKIQDAIMTVNDHNTNRTSRFDQMPPPMPPSIPVHVIPSASVAVSYTHPPPHTEVLYPPGVPPPYIPPQSMSAPPRPPVPQSVPHSLPPPTYQTTVTTANNQDNRLGEMQGYLRSAPPALGPRGMPGPRMPLQHHTQPINAVNPPSMPRYVVHNVVRHPRPPVPGQAPRK